MRWLVIPDMQVPYHDMKAIKSVLSFIEDIEPDGLLHVGDELDQPEPSRWNKGFAGEYAGTLQKSIDECHDIFGMFREALGWGKPFHLSRSNHQERISKYVHKYAPALSSLKSLEYEQLLGLAELEVTFHKRPFEFAPGWVLAHGDEGSQGRESGQTALGLARKWNKSVVCGHTHKAGKMHGHHYLNGKASQLLWGIEAGHLMQFGGSSNKVTADYLKAGSANWQQAVVLIDVNPKHVQTYVIELHNGKVEWDGVTYS